MARRKLKDDNIRKIARMGPKTLGVSLPIELMKQIGWKEKQKVVVKRTRGGFVIKDWKK